MHISQSLCRWNSKTIVHKLSPPPKKGASKQPGIVVWQVGKPNRQGSKTIRHVKPAKARAAPAKFWVE